MKRLIAVVVILFMVSANLFSQVSQGDIQMIQKYFGLEKSALVKQYMKLTPAQDSVFWPVYNRY